MRTKKYSILFILLVVSVIISCSGFEYEFSKKIAIGQEIRKDKITFKFTEIAPPIEMTMDNKTFFQYKVKLAVRNIDNEDFIIDTISHSSIMREGGKDVIIDTKGIEKRIKIAPGQTSPVETTLYSRSSSLDDVAFIIIFAEREEKSGVWEIKESLTIGPYRISSW